MDSEEEHVEGNKKKEIQKTVNILVKAINNKPSNKTVIKQIVNSIKETFTQDILIQINYQLDNSKDKIVNKKNLEYALKNLQLSYSSARKKNNSEEDSSGGKRKTSKRKTGKRKTSKRKTSKRKTSKRKTGKRKTKRAKY